ncbi:AMP-binding, conserved site-containing protein [Artemisia annua]|uniref:AMP-binding, conserved site-containing protein n=1 Tax=Artemisia annua TaxID=35608 RepID=A0A2U1QMB1_ARTAN|nr:AMP-binding, conserved site-containing protein [Artemisia annua]
MAMMNSNTFCQNDMVRVMARQHPEVAVTEGVSTFLIQCLSESLRRSHMLAYMVQGCAMNCCFSLRKSNYGSTEMPIMQARAHTPGSHPGIGFHQRPGSLRIIPGEELEEEWDAIALNYTSGTTSDPKGVVYSHCGAFLSTMSLIQGWEMGSEVAYLWSLPMFQCTLIPYDSDYSLFPWKAKNRCTNSPAYGYMENKYNNGAPQHGGKMRLCDSKYRMISWSMTYGKKELEENFADRDARLCPQCKNTLKDARVRYATHLCIPDATTTAHQIVLDQKDGFFVVDLEAKKEKMQMMPNTPFTHKVGDCPKMVATHNGMKMVDFAWGIVNVEPVSSAEYIGYDNLSSSGMSNRLRTPSTAALDATLVFPNSMNQNVVWPLPQANIYWIAPVIQACLSDAALSGYLMVSSVFYTGLEVGQAFVAESHYYYEPGTGKKFRSLSTDQRHLAELQENSPLSSVLEELRDNNVPISKAINLASSKKVENCVISCQCLYGL